MSLLYLGGMRIDCVKVPRSKQIADSLSGWLPEGKVNLSLLTLAEDKLVLEPFLIWLKPLISLTTLILMRKVEGIGIRGIALDWFRSYLTGRK